MKVCPRARILSVLQGVLTHNDVPEEPIVTLAHGRTAHRIHEARKQVLLLATTSTAHRVHEARKQVFYSH